MMLLKDHAVTCDGGRMAVMRGPAMRRGGAVKRDFDHGREAMLIHSKRCMVKSCLVPFLVNTFFLFFIFCIYNFLANDNLNYKSGEFLTTWFFF